MSITRTTWLIVALALAGCQRFTAGVNTVNVTTNAKVTKEEVVSKSFKIGTTPTIVVEVFSGAVTVARGADDTVDAEVTKRGGGDTEDAAMAMLKKIDVQMIQDGATIRVTVKVPPASTIIGEAPAKLKVPAAAKLDLRSDFGAIGVTGVDGAINARSSNGAVIVHDGKGPLKLASDFGSIDVRGANTTVTAKSSNGAVTVRGASGELDLKSDFGKIDIDAPSPKVTVKTSNGAVVVRGATGALDLKSDFGAIDVDTACAGVNARSSNGAVTVKKAKGPLVLKSDFGDVRAETPGGEVTAESSNGKVYVRGASGRLRAKSDFGALDLGAEKAVVTADSSNGTVKFAGSLADGEHRFHSGFGDVTVTLPADARFRLDARTSFGSVSSGFSVAAKGQPAKDRLQGTVGDSPTTVLKVTTDNGSIRVNRATENPR